jgi:hypothetical protein
MGFKVPPSEIRELGDDLSKLESVDRDSVKLWQQLLNSADFPVVKAMQMVVQDGTKCHGCKKALGKTERACYSSSSCCIVLIGLAAQCKRAQRVRRNATRGAY